MRTLISPSVQAFTGKTRINTRVNSDGGPIGFPPPSIPTTLIVSGAGSSQVNGTYTLYAGGAPSLHNGRHWWGLPGGAPEGGGISWDENIDPAGVWVMWDFDVISSYFTFSENLETGWTELDGSVPPPTVTAGP